MIKLLQLFLFILYIIFVPLSLGSVWANTYRINRNHLKMIYSYIIGFFTLLAIYELIEIPLVQIRYPFSDSCLIMLAVSIVFSIVCVVVTCKSIFSRIRNWRISTVISEIKTYSFYELLYLIGVIGLFLYQLYYTYFYEINQWSYDDESYVTWAAEALYYNQVFPGQLIDAKRVTQMSLFEPAFFAEIANVHVATMIHSILPLIYLAMAYGVIYLLAHYWIGSRENRLIFMLIVQLLYIFGFYSHYSLTFRLLGPIWNGKGILASVVNPLVMLITLMAVDKGYNIKHSLLLMIISIAAVSLTLGGVISIMAFVGIIVVVHFIKYHNKQFLKNVLYIAWTGIFPFICAGYYLIGK